MSAKSPDKQSKKEPLALFLVIKNIALVSHVVGVMVLSSMIISLIFGEFSALLPLFLSGGGTLLLSQVIYRLISGDKVLNLQDTFITITFAWLTCIALGGLVFWWVANALDGEATSTLQNFTNALFESASGSTSTGLSMVAFPENLPKTLQWLRSIFEWVGGLGLAILVFSFLDNSWSRFAIHESSTLPTIFQKSLKTTIQIVLAIYTSYTILIAVLFILFGLDVWSSINLSMSCLSTGGFAVSHHNMAAYSLAIKIIAAVGILLGSMSFTFHFRVFTWRRTALMREDQQHLLYFTLLTVVGLLLVFLPGRTESIVNTIFQWISAAGTCGLSTLSSRDLPAYMKYLLMLGMLIGGCLGSTAGGIKVRRIANILKIVWNNITILNTDTGQTKKKGKKQKPTQDVNKETFLLKGEVFIRLYQSFILFCLWMATLLVGWGILVYLLPEVEPFSVGFETISALSNAGLSVGITSATLSLGCKWCLMSLMFLGRVEIIPFFATIAAIMPSTARTFEEQTEGAKPYKRKKRHRAKKSVHRRSIRKS